MFWMLTLLASLAFAPCVLVPVWLDYRALATAGRLESDAIARMEADLDHQRRHIRALREDPLVVTRLARRDLAYTHRDEIAVPVDAGPVPRHHESVVPIPDVQPPAAVARLLDWVPAGDHLEFYGDPTSRATLMGLSGCVMLAAFVLFPPRRQLHG